MPRAGSAGFELSVRSWRRPGRSGNDARVTMSPGYARSREDRAVIRHAPTRFRRGSLTRQQSRRLAVVSYLVSQKSTRVSILKPKQVARTHPDPRTDVGRLKFSSTSNICLSFARPRCYSKPRVGAL